MEEDIKILEELLNGVELNFSGWIDRLNKKEKIALENLIKGYRELEEENKRLKMHRPIRFVPSINDNKSWYSPYKKY